MLVMGVVNATPDSFSDGGLAHLRTAAISRGRALFADGADIVDVGGESTRPGAAPVPVEEELARVVPVLAGLAGTGRLSIDTYKARVAEAAIEAGATIVNDISGGLLDPGLLEVVARRGVTVILGHLRGTPATMTEEAAYRDVVAEVRDELGARITAARSAGIAPDRIWIDPGLGFAKKAEHSATVLANLDALRSLGCPIVVGASRKSFLSALGDPEHGVPVGEREALTAAAHAIAIGQGAKVVRVHDVVTQARAVRLAAAVVGMRRAPLTR